MDTESDTARQLLAEIEDFCARHRMSGTAFGLAVANDSHIVGRLRAGLGMSLRRYDRVRAFMRSYDLGKQ